MSMLYDLSMIWDIANNDRDFVKEIVSQFIYDTDNIMHSIELSIEEENMSGVMFSAHRLKPSLTSLGIIGIKEDVSKLEQLAQLHSDWGEISARYKIVAEKMNAVTEALKADLFG
jgi:HPt (histidine-containing phosphotransfer) domain-containing protein